MYKGSSSVKNMHGRCGDGRTFRLGVSRSLSEVLSKTRRILRLQEELELHDMYSLRQLYKSNSSFPNILLKRSLSGRSFSSLVSQFEIASRLNAKLASRRRVAGTSPLHHRFHTIVLQSPQIITKFHSIVSLQPE